MESSIWPEPLPIPLILEKKLAGRSKFSLNSFALSSLPSNSQFLHIISIAGSQSSGKSTLANHAFSLNFPMMASDNAGQTTHGIDIQFTNFYICLDMEGSDSDERDKEDNSYIERMIGAFGLLVSNLLIYNINIRDIRSKREVDYIATMMTHYLRICNEKRRILFCIRDVVEGFHNLKDIRTKISQTFNAALNKAKISTRNDSNNQTSTDDLENVFEMDMITCSVYGEGKFVNEKVVMRRFRDKVKGMLQYLNPFEVKSLRKLWSETWNNIDKNEMIDFGILRVKKAWEILRQKLISRYISLVSEIHSNGDYVDKLNKYYTEFSNEINLNYAYDKYARQALLKLWRQEFAEQAVNLEVEHFKVSIKNYFYSESEHTHSLYADLISIYEEIDKDDSYRKRIRKSDYKKFLHKSAKRQNLYIDTIKQSLDLIYLISQERIKQYLAELNKADITKINLKIDLTDLDTMYLALFSGIGGVLASVGLGLVAAEAAAAATAATAATVTAATVSAAMITGGVFLGVGVIGAATTVGVMAAWARRTVWRELATEVRKSIIDHDSFKKTYQDCIDMVNIRDHPSS